MKTRLAALVAVVLASLVLVPAPAWAGDTVGDHLEIASRAEYSGEQVVSCQTPDGVKNAVYTLTQKDGKLYVSVEVDATTTVVVGGGSYEVRNADGSVSVTSVEGAGTVDMGVRYDSQDGAIEQYLGREAVPVDIMQGALRRARMTFDAETGALLRTQIYNSNGSLYCETRFVKFVPGEPAVAAGGGSTTQPLAAATDSDLPKKVAGFSELDLFTFNKDSVMAYYSDGLFSFTLLHSARSVQVAEIANAPEVKVGDYKYKRWFGPGQVVYVWDSEVGGLALLGDLPLDMQEQVLGKLPFPKKPNVIVRIIQSLFN